MSINLIQNKIFEVVGCVLMNSVCIINSSSINSTFSGL